MAIENSTSISSIVKLLNIISKPLEMYDSDWAMNYVLNVYAVLERGLLENWPQRMIDTEWIRHEHNFISAVSRLKSDVFKKSRGFIKET